MSELPRYRTMNWKSYNAALKASDSLTFLLYKDIDMKKTITLISLFLIVILMAIFIGKLADTPEKISAIKKSREQHAGSDLERIRKEAAGVQAFLVEHIVDAYEANTVAADRRFKGRTLKITGDVININTDFRGDPYLVLKSGENRWKSAQFSFDKSADEQLAQVTKGERVTLVCIGDGDIVKTPMFSSCVLL